MGAFCALTERCKLFKRTVPEQKNGKQRKRFTVQNIYNIVFKEYLVEEFIFLIFVQIS